MNEYTTKFPAGHPGTTERPNHCPVYTPDGGVIMCSTPADAARVADLGNAVARAKRMEAALTELVKSSEGVKLHVYDSDYDRLESAIEAAQCDMDFYGYSMEEAERAFAAAGLPGDRP